MEQSQVLFNCENFLKLQQDYTERNIASTGRGTTERTGKSIQNDLCLTGFQIRLTVNDRKRCFMLSHSNICSLSIVKKFILHILNFHPRTKCDKEYTIQSFI